MIERPSIEVAVIMRKVRTASPWAQWRWELDSVVANEEAFGGEPRLLHRGEDGERWLHPGFLVELFRDDGEGYYLNLTSPAPCYFVLWRMEEEPSVAEEPIPRPLIVSLSYHDAGRWLDAQETVEQVPAPQEVIDWMWAFTQEHYVPEPRRRKRPESFRRLEDRFGQPASVSTHKKFGGEH
ncbi:MAG TPA: DUF3305 domain-containing protein [Ramlibacter sp.]|uniref:DUF3305 domain-containing protein n=1 Tax=Ramlibacter sp. TaxID=1917967 RepID=UPI002D7FF788|nr:DUF3305 domain-containing protein [Ramlibacter sp.]HET8748543.1 DUF3305 domain-containing protein [Ramlibacter sp.]